MHRGELAGDGQLLDDRLLAADHGASEGLDALSEDRRETGNAAGQGERGAQDVGQRTESRARRIGHDVGLGQRFLFHQVVGESPELLHRPGERVLDGHEQPHRIGERESRDRVAAQQQALQKTRGGGNGREESV